MAIIDQNNFEIAFLILSCMLISFVITPISIWLAKKLDLIDYPGQLAHHIHSKPTPRAGGVSLFLSMAVIFILNKFWDQADIVHVLLPVVVVFAFGLWDDKFGMDAPKKMAGQLIAVTILVLFDVRVQFLENQAFFIQLDNSIAYWADIFITYFWMIGITNAFNMVDSMDGLAIGLTRITSAFFLFLSIISEQSPLIYLSAVIFGISWGIAFFNERPAKTFLGDSGAQSFGFMLAAIAIMYHPQAYSQQSSWFLPIMFFTIPIFDTTLVTISRFRNRLPFYKANLDHTYHRLVKLGWDPYRAVSITQICAVVFSLAAICATYLPSIAANMIFLSWLIIFSVMIIILEKNFYQRKKK